MTIFETREDWLRWRKNKIGASDAPIIMGVSSYKTPLKLHIEKLDPNFLEDESGAFAKKAGNQAEPKIRKFLEFMYEDTFDPVVIEWASDPRITCSLDGRSSRNPGMILEIKIMGAEAWELMKSEGTIPEQYMIQVQHQLMVSGANSCLFAAYLYDKEDPFLNNDMNRDMLATIQVLPKLTLQKDILRAEMAFLKDMDDKKLPEPSDRDFVKVKAGKLATRWKILKLKQKKLDDEVKELETELKSLAESTGHLRVMVGSVKLIFLERVGSIEYEKIPELKNVDLEKYRKDSSTYWKMSP